MKINAITNIEWHFMKKIVNSFKVKHAILKNIVAGPPESADQDVTNFQSF